LRIPGEMTIDPLYELEGWKASVETPNDFEKLAVLEVVTLQNGSHAPGEELVRDYCQGMFEPFKPEELARLIGPASSGPSWQYLAKSPANANNLVSPANNDTKKN